MMRLDLPLTMTRPTGRFAPSPTGALHAGSIVAALASWLDARARDGLWLVRIEDLDRARCSVAAEQHILRQLADCQLWPDAVPQRQSQRVQHYQDALARLVERALAYPCACSRADIERRLTASDRSPQRHTERVYAGHCRNGLAGRPARAWRFDTRCADRFDAAPALHWHDRRLGWQQQDVEGAVGDFVLKRADGCFAYQLAVVVDDAGQGVTDVVRGADLADNTARQVLLQRALGLPTPRYLHTALVLAADGQKLSKQTGAQASDTRDALAVLNQAAAVLGLPAAGGPVAAALACWVEVWRDLYQDRRKTA